ncbi:NAD(P)-dependent alcohol dehydrogenase [Niveibacterium sp. SC-1]|uniref:NADPH-dependent aldehyde reductase Ahr n=1 Tax=Niveibacterium sp. SC-1 TaxID=3135646 RepID=UPI00311F6E0A
MSSGAQFHAWAAKGQGQALEAFDFDPGPLGDEEVEIEVEHCGICHSDLSMIDNEWGFTRYPFVPGHEAVGRVVTVGARAKGLKAGQRVGVGWNRGSCMHCHQCIGGDHHLCGSVEGTIVGRHGAFANRIRAHWAWAIPLPEGLAAADAGPLFCGGITVFSPIVIHGIKPTQRVGVVGIGGLGHMAIRFLDAWGCEVTAFTSSEKKRDEAIALGADHVVPSTDSAALAKIAGSLDLILVTVNVALDWQAYINALAPRGRLHVVGAVLEPIPVSIFSLMGGQKSLSSSPTGSPATIAEMLAFCAHHDIRPQTEHFPMSKVNDALQHLRDGKARYRIVLDV